VPASQRGEQFAHGVAFVALAPIELTAAEQSEPEERIYPLLAARVADALGFTFAGPDAPYEQIAGYLSEKELLLVLDNCEHVPVAGFAVDLLERAPRLKLVITTRGRLNVRGEQVIELTGLDFPSHSDLASQSGEHDYSAIRLFRDTAQSVNSRLEWTPAAASAAAQICRMVAGHPLAIELAASLARLMPIQEIADEIAANLGFLQSTRRDLPERHQSLRAVFDHSWKLLAPAEQRALRQLTVFRGGFSREAAAQVCGATLPLLAALVDNSLVRQIRDPGQAIGRYELLELVRQYAAEQLTASEPGALAERHARYYLGFLSQRAADLRGSQQQAAAAEIHREIENIRAAWRWAVEQGQIELIGPALEGLFFFYEMRSWFREGAEVFAHAAARLARICVAAPPSEAQQVWGQLLARQGWCMFQIGRPAEARALLQQSLALLEPLGDPARQVLPLNYLASAAYYQGDYAAAEQVVAAALSASQASGDRHGATVALTVFGQIAALVGRYEDARRYSEQSLAIERELGNRWGMVFPLISLGRVAQAQGDYRSAQRYFQEGLAIRQGFGDTRGVALCLQYLGDTAHAQADIPEAGWFYHEALALFRTIGNRGGEVAVLAKLGYNALSIHDTAAWAYFRQALAVAWDTQITPRILEALVGAATALAAANPARACALGSLVERHPAATQESRERAAALLASIPASAAARAEQPEPEPDLASVVGLLLRTE
jgi:predicted ATPase